MKLQWRLTGDGEDGQYDGDALGRFIVISGRCCVDWANGSGLVEVMLNRSGVDSLNEGNIDGSFVAGQCLKAFCIFTNFTLGSTSKSSSDDDNAAAVSQLHQPCPCGVFSAIHCNA